MSGTVRWWGLGSVGALSTLLILVACEDMTGTAELADAPSGPSRAFSVWEPGPRDSCSKAIHDQYAVVGQDGRLYPTWHPSTDPTTGCTFGHEHGRDPRASDLFDDVGFIPFGLANEAADLFAPHPGYKIEWENDVPMRTGLGEAGSALLDIRCDVMFELHQGTAGSGRFVNPSHEMAYHARCTDGTEVHLQFVTTIGQAGEFVRSCDGAHVQVNPSASGKNGGGKRVIPARSCMEEHILVPSGQRSSFGRLRESWQFSESIRSSSGRSLASFGPYFNVFNPSRYHDPSQPNILGSVIDLCYEVTPEGERASGGACADVLERYGDERLTWDDPRSPFTGSHRDVDINSLRVRNEDGPEVWYTDAWGENGRTEPFQGSIRQFVARVNNEAVSPSGPSIGRHRDYHDAGVHAPN